MIPLFDSELFAFIGSADGELIVNCRNCREEADAELDASRMLLLVTCAGCGIDAEFRFRSSVQLRSAFRSPRVGVVEGDANQPVLG